MSQRKLAEKKEEEERDYWFNHLRPITKPKQTWRENSEGGSSGDSNRDEANQVTPARGEDNPGLGDGNTKSGNCNPESGNYHPKSGNRNPGKEIDR
jgi:hypothetical protein